MSGADHEVSRSRALADSPSVGVIESDRSRGIAAQELIGILQILVIGEQIGLSLEGIAPLDPALLAELTP